MGGLFSDGYKAVKRSVINQLFDDRRQVRMLVLVLVVVVVVGVLVVPGVLVLVLLVLVL